MASQQRWRWTLDPNGERIPMILPNTGTKEYRAYADERYHEALEQMKRREQPQSVLSTSATVSLIRDIANEEGD